jgi:hypothetical protein
MLRPGPVTTTTCPFRSALSRKCDGSPTIFLAELSRENLFAFAPSPAPSYVCQMRKMSEELRQC